MRKILLSLVAAVGVAASALPFRPGDGAFGQEKAPAPGVEKFLQSFGTTIQIRESKPVRSNDAEFVAVVQANWKAPKTGVNDAMAASVEIQLRITNLSKADLTFPSQTFGIKLTTAEGKEVKPRRNFKATTTTRPVLLPPNTSFACCPRAEMRRSDADAAEFVFFDGTGSELVFGPLAAGRYKLAFTYSAAGPERKTNKVVGDAVPWAGDAVTDEVVIELAETPIRGFLTGPEYLWKDFAEPVRIDESKAVTVNGAKFVLAAQAEWRAGKPSEEIVPIEIQLRITNVSKGDLVFPTFDRLGLVLSDTSGKRILPRGGRSRTRFTLPILIPAGASYSFGRGMYGGVPYRSSGLYCDEKSMKSELRYWDGTGMSRSFGPLEPGRYKLAFRYVVPARGEGKLGEPAIWSGEVLTGEIPVEVSKR